MMPHLTWLSFLLFFLLSLTCFENACSSLWLQTRLSSLFSSLLEAFSRFRSILSHLFLVRLLCILWIPLWFPPSLSFLSQWYLFTEDGKRDLSAEESTPDSHKSQKYLWQSLIMRRECETQTKQEESDAYKMLLPLVFSDISRSVSL